MTGSVIVHSTSIVEPGAELDTGVNIGPYAVVGSKVKLGKNTKVHSHVVIKGLTTIGEENEIFPFASLGNPPQDLKYKGEPTALIIGNHNKIREYVTLQPGTIQDKGQTLIGHQNLFMAYSHVAHDCILGDNNVVANGVQLAGHVTIKNKAILGGLSAVHQFVTIGDLSFVAGGSMVIADVLPFTLVEGNRATLRGLNLVGLQRNLISPEARQALKAVYKIFFVVQHPTLEDAFASITEDLLLHAEVQMFLQAIKSAKRGFVRNAKKSDQEPSSYA